MMHSTVGSFDMAADVQPYTNRPPYRPFCVALMLPRRWIIFAPRLISPCASTSSNEQYLLYIILRLHMKHFCVLTASSQ